MCLTLKIVTNNGFPAIKDQQGRRKLDKALVERRSGMVKRAAGDHGIISYQGDWCGSGSSSNSSESRFGWVYR